MAGVAVERDATIRTVLAGGGALVLAIIIGQVVDGASRSQSDFTQLASLPQLTGRPVGLDVRREVPYDERSPEKIRDMLLGRAFTNKDKDLERWRRENNITPDSIRIIKPQDPEVPFTARVPEGKKALLTNLPTKNLPAALSAGNIIPETTVFDVSFILEINDERYGVIIGTTCLEKTDAGNDRCAVTPFFFNARDIPIYEGLPAAPVPSPTVVYPQTKTEIRAGFYGRKLPRSEPPRVIGSSYTVFPGKSSFWAAKGAR